MMHLTMSHDFDQVFFVSNKKAYEPGAFLCGVACCVALFGVLFSWHH